MKTIFCWTLFLGICALCMTSPQDEDPSYLEESFSGLLSTYSELRPRALSSPRRACSSDERCEKSCKARKHDYGQCVNRICNCDDYPPSIKRMIRRSSSSSPKRGIRSPSRTPSTRSRRYQKASVSKTPRRTTIPKKRPSRKKGGSSTTPRRGSRSPRTPSRRRSDRTPARSPSRGSKRGGKGGSKIPARGKRGNGNNRAGRGGRVTPSKTRRPSKPVKSPAWMQGNIPYTPPPIEYPSYNTANKGPSARPFSKEPFMPSLKIPQSATQQLPGTSFLGDVEDNDVEEEDRSGIGANMNSVGAQVANSAKPSRGDQVGQPPFKQPQTEKYDDFANSGKGPRGDQVGQPPFKQPQTEKYDDFANSGKGPRGDQVGQPPFKQPQTEKYDDFTNEYAQNKVGDAEQAKGSKPPSEFEDSMQFDMGDGGDKTGDLGAGKAKDSNSPSEYEDFNKFDMADGDETDTSGEGKKKESKGQQLGQKPGQQIQTEENDDFAIAPSKFAAPGLGKGPTGEQSQQKPTSQSKTEGEDDFGDNFAQGGFANTGKTSGSIPPSEFDSMQFDTTGSDDKSGVSKENEKPKPALPKQETDFESFNPPGGDYEVDGMYGMPDGMLGGGLGGQNKSPPNGGQIPQQVDLNDDSSPFGSGENKMPNASNGFGGLDMDSVGLEGFQNPQPSQNRGPSKNNDQAMMNVQGDLARERPPFGPFNGQTGESLNPNDRSGPNLNGGIPNGAMTNPGLRDDDDMMSDMDYSSMMKQMGGNQPPMANSFGPMGGGGMGGMNHPSGMGQTPPNNTPFPMKGGGPMDDLPDFDLTMGQIPSKEPVATSNKMQQASVKKSGLAAEGDSLKSDFDY